MYITIIGGSGFIGTRLTTRLLAAGHSVKIADKNNSKKYPELYVYADVREPDTLRKELAGSDIIINLAAEHSDNVTPTSLYDDVNVTGSENICKVCTELGINRIIFTSSVAVYGFGPAGTDETGKIDYFNDYGRTKWLAEEKYREWLSTNSKNVLTIIRPAVTFGEQNRGNIYNLIRQVAEGKFFMVGKGTNIKSMAYVENVASFIEYNLNNGAGEHLYNYVDKPDFDMNTFVSIVSNVLGKSDKLFHWPYWLGYFGGLCFDALAIILHRKFTISSIRVKKFCTDSMWGATNIKKTNFKAPVELVDGLERTIKYEFQLDNK